MKIQQLTIIGTGLIGGSFALALKKRGFEVRVVGCDKEEVLARANKMKAIDAGIADPIEAIAGSDVVVLATPVGQIVDLIERIGPRLEPQALMTDVGSTKVEIMARARSVFGASAPRRFLGGHPMAGREDSGIEHADANLFKDAPWLFTPQSGQKIADGLSGEFLKLVERVGAKRVLLDAERHDRLCAWVSHLPQMLSTALAAAIEEEFGDDAELKSVSGQALSDMTRLAASPYAMWRDIALTNTSNIEAALLKLEQKLAHLRENLRTAELREEFDQARRFHHGDAEARKKK
ncbi:MAG TPA: prephenate dehydrogenase/arogenate dehydrogenase family protein [Terriglobales bacterium]|nr:prephenate dehydrogenase/arogenate dehydrogenase family protein [Terriglobales bacterium]